MTSANLQAFLGRWLPSLEEEMQAALADGEDRLAGFYGMLRYHMGWVDDRFQPHVSPSGKRLRPMLCLLACAETGGDPGQALPVAAAIELLHNFSLIHDDVEDGDEMRRHRYTVWKVWGMPQAVNAGDGLFAISFAALQGLTRRGVVPATVLVALELFTRTCIELTEGQYLDIGFEQHASVSEKDYMRMIGGKTAALIGASVAIGAVIGGASAEQSRDLREFGRSLGLAFQIQDDVLGIWGDPAVTGKAAGNDILRRKKSLPLLHALNHPAVGDRLHALLADAQLGPAQLPDALALLDEAGSRAHAEAQLVVHHDAGVAALRRALGSGAEQSALLALADSLLHRRM